MENNKTIIENPSNNNSKKAVSFANPNTPGFLEPNKNNSLVIEKVESVNPIASFEVPTDNEISIIKQSITDIEEAQNEFAPSIIEQNFPIDNNTITNISSEETNNTESNFVSADLINNPSNIFNISLISNDNSISKNDINTEIKTKAITLPNNDNNQELNESIANKTIQAPNVDFFNFDFKSSINNEATTTIENEAVFKTSNDEIQVDFNSVIRATDNQEVIPEQNDRIELSKFLEPREHIIKKADEVSENDNNVIRVNDGSLSSKHRTKNNLINFSLYAFYALLGALLLIFFFKIYGNFTDFALTRKEITLAINSTYQAEIVANSKIQDNSKYEWSSSNTNIVKVDENGLITAVNGGEAVITVSKSNKKKTLKITTIDIEVESITFKQNKLNLKVGEEYTLQPIINNDESIIIDLLWESSDESIITVDQNGHIIAHNAGIASVLVFDTISGLGEEIVVEVKQSNKPTDDKPSTGDDDDNDNVQVSSVILNKSDTVMKIGEEITLKAIVRPANATDKKVTWASSNTNIASVSTTGKVTAKKAGSATITATTKNGKKASIKITVTEKFINVTNISLNVDNQTIEVGETITLKATIKPDNATNKKVTWASSDTSIATVSSSGKVTALKAGTVTITATSKDGNKKAVATITIKAREIIEVSGVSLNTNNLDLNVGNTYKLEASISPSNATIKDVEWSSSNPNVATVSNGKITALSPGSTTITVTTKNGNKTATCKVTVKEPPIEVEEISLNRNFLTLWLNDTFQLVATISPSNATNKKLTWSSSDSSIVSVDSNGLMTAKKPGNAIITVTSENGIKNTCEVTVPEE